MGDYSESSTLIDELYLVLFQSIWSISVHSALLWTAGPLWGTFRCCGSLGVVWATLGYFGPLGQFGLLWSFGPFWVTFVVWATFFGCLSQFALV